jgi:hypothetical protein
MRKPTPEDRERLRQALEQGREARRNMQEIIDRVEARRHAELERRAARWRRMRRLLRFGRAA